MGNRRTFVSVIVGILIIGSLSFVGQNSAYAGVDQTAPDLICPGDIIISQLDPTDPGFTGVATATDDSELDPITFSDSVSGVNPVIIQRTWVAVDIWGNSASCVQIITIEPLEVDIDVKPKSCPNPINPNSNGVLPIAILGTDSFDVTQVDVDSVTLEGVSPIRHSIKDVATPLQVPTVPEPNSCTDEGPDGFDDLTLKFNMQEVVAALGPIFRGDIITVELEGQLLDGTPIEGYDIIIIR